MIGTSHEHLMKTASLLPKSAHVITGVERTSLLYSTQTSYSLLLAPRSLLWRLICSTPNKQYHPLCTQMPRVVFYVVICEGSHEVVAVVIVGLHPKLDATVVA